MVSISAISLFGAGGAVAFSEDAFGTGNPLANVLVKLAYCGGI